MVYVTSYRRVTPEKPGKEVPERGALLGRWTVTKQHTPNRNSPPAMVESTGGLAAFTPEYAFLPFATEGGSDQWYAAKYGVDATKTSAWIDLTFPDEPLDQGFGVYDLNGDTLRLSIRRGVPRVFRTLEFRAGIDSRPGEDRDRRGRPGLLPVRAEASQAVANVSLL